MGCGCHTCSRGVFVRPGAVRGVVSRIAELLCQPVCTPLKVGGFSGSTRRVPTYRPVRLAIPCVSCDLADPKCDAHYELNYRRGWMQGTSHLNEPIQSS